MLMSWLILELKLILISLICCFIAIFAVEIIKPFHGEEIIWTMGFVCGLAIMHNYLMRALKEFWDTIDQLF